MKHNLGFTYYQSKSARIHLTADEISTIYSYFMAMFPSTKTPLSKKGMSGKTVALLIRYLTHYLEHPQWYQENMVGYMAAASKITFKVLYGMIHISTKAEDRPSLKIGYNDRKITNKRIDNLINVLMPHSEKLYNYRLRNGHTI